MEVMIFRYTHTLHHNIYIIIIIIIVTCPVKIILLIIITSIPTLLLLIITGTIMSFSCSLFWTFISNYWQLQTAID